MTTTFQCCLCFVQISGQQNLFVDLTRFTTYYPNLLFVVSLIPVPFTSLLRTNSLIGSLPGNVAPACKGYATCFHADQPAGGSGGDGTVTVHQ